MEQGDLIFLYHYLVMGIIAATAIVALGGILQIGIFKEVSDTYKKILVGALLVEIAGAFVGVYKTLPELDFKKAEKYKIEIKYVDLLNGYVEKMEGYQQSCFKTFKEPNRLASFFRCEEYVNTYNVLRSLAPQNGFKDSVSTWKQNISGEKKSCIEDYEKISGIFSECKSVLGKYYRYTLASNGVGKGEVYVSLNKDFYEGVVNYRFPREEQAVILELSGKIVGGEYLSFRFDQSASALEFKSNYIPRDSASFEVCLKRQKKGHYEGKILLSDFKCGVEDLDALKSIAQVSMREMI